MIFLSDRQSGRINRKEDRQTRPGARQVPRTNEKNEGWSFKKYGETKSSQGAKTKTNVRLVDYLGFFLKESLIINSLIS